MWTTLAQAAEGQWMPEQASTYAAEVDFVFIAITLISLFFFVGICIAVLAFVIKYRQRPGHESPQPSPSHNTAIEVFWSAVPAAILVVIFWYSLQTYLDMSTPPAGAYEINVTGNKWFWSFDYKEGKSDTEYLRVPVNRPIRLILRSNDVIHSVFVPAFRIKKDAVPGRYNETWFEATQVGKFNLFCAEYCGTRHSDMVAKVWVMSQEDFDAWLASPDYAEDATPVQKGESLVTKKCAVCHAVGSIPVAGMTGPTLWDLYGKQREFRDGTSAVADENYIRSSIVNPQGQIVQGYGAVMPTFQGQLSDDEITWIIDYIKTLNERGGVTSGASAGASDGASSGESAEPDADASALPSGDAATASEVNDRVSSSQESLS